MRRKNNLVLLDAQLLDHLAEMAVTEDPIRRQIVRGIHKVRGRRRRLARPRNARLRVAYDAVVEIDPTRGGQRLQAQNHRRGIASWIGYQLRRPDRFAMQFGTAVNALRLHLFGESIVVVVKVVNRPMRGTRQPPRPAQIDHPQSAAERLRRLAPRLLMRRSEKEQIDAALFEKLPREGLDHERSAAIVIGQLRMEIRQRLRLRAPPGEDRRPPLADGDGGAAGAPIPCRRTHSLPTPRSGSDSDSYHFGMSRLQT